MNNSIYILLRERVVIDVTKLAINIGVYIGVCVLYWYFCAYICTKYLIVNIYVYTIYMTEKLGF